MTAERLLKLGYIVVVRSVGHFGELSGFDQWLEIRAQNSRCAHWLRSLTAIHDLETMIRLDVPWWTYRAISEVEEFLLKRPSARVFEFGSGASTLWLARRAGQLTSVEHDAAWYRRVQAALVAQEEAAHVDLRYIAPDTSPHPDPLYRSAKAGAKGTSFSEYACSVEATDEPFDLIVIDGRARPACLRHALGHLAPGGLIVFDNSHRIRYYDAIAASGLAAQRFKGLAPALPYPDETTLLREMAP